MKMSMKVVREDGKESWYQGILKKKDLHQSKSYAGDKGIHEDKVG